MLQVIDRTMPRALLLHWPSWLSQIKSTVKYIKGVERILEDFLSQPKDYKYSITMVVHPIPNHKTKPLLTVRMASSSNTSSPKNEELVNPEGLPDELIETIADLALKDRSLLNYQTFFTITLKKHGLFLRNLRFHPDYPFLNIFHIHDLNRLPKEALCFFWYLFEAHTVAISFNAAKLFTYLFQCLYEKPPKDSQHLFTLFTWFKPVRDWIRLLSVCPKPYVLIMFRMPCTYLPPTVIKGQKQAIVYHSPLAFIHNWYNINMGSKAFELNYHEEFLEIRKCLADANQVNPSTIPTTVWKNMELWPHEHPVAAKWISTLDHWFGTHLTQKIETSGEGSADDDDDLFEVHFDPYEDDPSHPDSRWK